VLLRAVTAVAIALQERPHVGREPFFERIVRGRRGRSIGRRPVLRPLGGLTPSRNARRAMHSNRRCREQRRRGQHGFRIC
jgi:hypothetical protein